MVYRMPKSGWLAVKFLGTEIFAMKYWTGDALCGRFGIAMGRGRWRGGLFSPGLFDIGRAEARSKGVETLEG